MASHIEIVRQVMDFRKKAGMDGVLGCLSDAIEYHHLFEDGRITGLEGYLDPARAEPLMI